MIRIITDSGADYPPALAERDGVDIVNLTITFEEKEFTGTNHEFYEKLKTVHVLPKTSQPSPAVFEDCFRRHVEQGDEVVAVCMSGGISGTVQAAHIGAQPFGNQVHIVDSRVATCGQAALISAAMTLREGCKNARELSEKLTALIPKLRFFALVSNLKYLRLGGRLSAAAAAIGSMLGICPILTMKEGLVVPTVRERGMENAMKRMAAIAGEDTPDPRFPIFVYHVISPDMRARLSELLRQHGGLWAQVKHVVNELGPTIGTYAGPGAVGIGFIAT